MISVLLFFILAFVFLWIGSGLAVSAVTKISYSVRMSSFFVSFFVLGIFTSVTEIMVGISAVIDNKPEIYVGNLMGSSVVVFMLIIPLLAVIGNGIKLNNSFRFKDLVFAALTVGFPALLTLDNKIGIIDAVILVIIYICFIFRLERDSGSVNRIIRIDVRQRTLIKSFLKIVAAIVLVYSGSNILVEETPKLGEMLRISPFIISALLLSIGTNIPELSIAVRSILAKRRDIAFGDYVGSATLNTLEMGVLTLFRLSPAPADGSNFSVIAFVLGLTLFVFFVKRKNDISRREGIVLLVCYLFFVFLEVFTGPGWNFLKSGKN
jgi:cation:H+ antiporter